MPDSEFQYHSDNIIVGAAELPAIRQPHGVCWVLPGGQIECDRNVAEHIASNMDRVISGNLRKYSRTLFG